MILKQHKKRPPVPACKHRTNGPSQINPEGHIVIKKYTPHASPTITKRILTNDVYLAAYLLTRHCSIVELCRNDRRRVSFVVEGSDVERLRQEYNSGPVYLNVRFFRENLVTLRRLMDGKQRSVPHGCLQTEPQC